MSAEHEPTYKILQESGGLICHSVPGETLCYKVCGDDTGGGFDYLALEIQPASGPPLHVHDVQHETVHFLSGRFKVQAGEEMRLVDSGGFLWVAPGVPHAFLNISEQPGVCVLTYSPGNSHRFFQEFGPAVRSADGPPDTAALAAIFERHQWRLVGPPLTPEVDG